MRALLLALALAGAARAEEVVIEIQDFAFVPAEITVNPGTTLVWHNRDDTPHSVVEVGKSWRSPALDTDERFALTVTAPGEIGYYCGFHPHMQGKIHVAP